MLTRRLALRRETLAALSSDDMAYVAGGAATGPTCVTCFPSREPLTGCEYTVPTLWRTCTCP